MDFKDLLKWIGAAAFVLIFLVFAIFWVMFHRGEQGQFQQGGYSSVCGKVPQPYASIFDGAAKKYDIPAALLAAIFSCGEHAGSWPDYNGPWGTSSAGAQGPFQFMPATWNQYGVDGNNDGIKDVQNIYDASFGAANYLSANIKSSEGSFEEKIKKAIYAYNHAQWYVDQVYKCYQNFLCAAVATGCDDPQSLMKIYGSSKEEVEKQLVDVDFVGKTVKFHRLAAPYLEAVSNDIKASGISYDFRRIGTFKWRGNVNNPSELSLHSFGIAIDINDDTNPNGSTKTDIPQGIINIFKSHGFRWGGDYQSTKDPMHFEWLGYDCSGNLITK